MANNITSLPWSVQPEVVEGCQLRCWFCGIHSIRGKELDLNFMEVELVAELFKQFNEWRPKIRVEYNNHGEPTLHPRWWDIVEATRREAPRAQIQLQTNGYRFFPQEIQKRSSAEADFEASLVEFFHRGGNLLVLNCYKPGTYAYAMEKLCDYLGRHPGAFKVVDFYHNNPDNLGAYTYYSPKAKTVFVFDDLGAMNVEGKASRRPAKWIDNEAGNVPEKALRAKLGREPIKEPLKRGCTRPYREIVVNWDGYIPMCCYDWRTQQVLGKFPDQSLRDIWEGEAFTAARVLLDPRTKERNMSPCDVCDLNGGFRIGLIKRPETSMTVEQAYAVLESMPDKSIPKVGV